MGFPYHKGKPVLSHGTIDEEAMAEEMVLKDPGVDCVRVEVQSSLGLLVSLPTRAVQGYKFGDTILF